MDYEYTYDVHKDILRASEEIARAIDLRSKGSVILEIFAPTTSALALLITRRAWQSLVRRFPKIALSATATTMPVVIASASTGVGTPAALAALSAAEVTAIAYFFISEVASITSLIADFPSDNEATPLLPAASYYDLISTDPALIQRYFVPISKDLISFGALYCCHFTKEVDATSPTKMRLYAALMAGWLTGYVPSVVLPFCAKARSRLVNYAGSNLEAIAQRFEKDLFFILRYSGIPFRRLPRAMKVVDLASISYNIGVASYNTASAYCRTVDCPASSVVTQEVLDFLLSPSSFTWRLPFTRKDNADVPTYHINFLDVEAAAASASRSAQITNTIITEADRLSEEYNEN